MRYEIGLILRITIALAIFLLPFLFDVNILQTALEEVTFKTVYAFLDKSGAQPQSGSYSVKYAITILGGEATINIVKYCVTASAYYLLILLNLLTMKISFLKRILMFILGSILIYLMNLVRIIILIVILIKNNQIFEPAHFIGGILLSLVSVLIVWTLTSLLFKVKTIPIISDLKYLIHEITKRHNKK